MAIPSVTIAQDNLLRVAFLGSANGSAIVCVQYYSPATNFAFVPNVTTLDEVNAEAATLWTTYVLPHLCDTYTFKSVTTTIYKDPYMVVLPGPPVKKKMNPFATVPLPTTGTGAIATDSLPDYNVFRVFKRTGRAGRSWRGFMNFSPMAESYTTGQIWTPGFIAGGGNAIMGFVGQQLWKLTPAKTMYPVLFRITEYLNQANPNLSPASAPWANVFDSVILNNRVGILRSRKMRAPTA